MDTRLQYPSHGVARSDDGPWRIEEEISDLNDVNSGAGRAGNRPNEHDGYDESHKTTNLEAHGFLLPGRNGDLETGSGVDDTTRARTRTQYAIGWTKVNVAAAGTS